MTEDFAAVVVPHFEKFPAGNAVKDFCSADVT